MDDTHDTSPQHTETVTSRSEALAGPTPTSKPPEPPMAKPTEPPSKPSTPAANTDDSTVGAVESDNTDLEVPSSSSALQKVRDVDGVQLITKRLSLTRDDLVQSATEVAAPSSYSGSRPPSVAASKKELVHEVDLQRYRKLMKGIIPLRSSLMKANVDSSTTDVNGRKSHVHFSDQSGYYLSSVRSYDRDRAVTFRRCFRPSMCFEFEWLKIC